jgi:hypothetical protein
MATNWLPEPSDPRTDAGTRLEHAACLTALRVGKRSPARVARSAGLSDSTSRMTFGVLMHYADFPIRPAVTGEPLDDVKVLLERFDKSRTVRVWDEIWSVRSDCHPGSRYMVIRGSALGVMIVHDNTNTLGRSCIHVFDRPSHTVLIIEPFRAWCAALAWAIDIEGENYDDDANTA